MTPKRSSMPEFKFYRSTIELHGTARLAPAVKKFEGIKTEPSGILLAYYFYDGLIPWEPGVEKLSGPGTPIYSS
jgi:hypothetical protein